MLPEIRAKAELIAGFILRQLDRRPLLVSMQGPQGCGKSTLAAAMVSVLKEKDVHCAVASMDDFYLPHSGLKALAERYPDNAMLQGRGPPGTHDLPLMSGVLGALARGEAAELPSFDKSLNRGEGDRGAAQLMERVPDVFVLEGWSLGYAPLGEDELRDRWASGATASTHPFQSVLDLNRHLEEVNRLDVFHAHVRVTPQNYDYVYAWRLEQEHAMKARNGGRGMSDDEVRAFVDRYMPTYEVWGETRPARSTLDVVFDENRRVVDTSEG